jgi:ParB-like chromosome segregation protein Spo0J
MERARSIERLMQESGWSAAQAAAKLGEQSESMISKLLTLLVHPKEVQDLIDAGRIPMSSAYAIATVPDAVERQRLINEVLGGRLTRDRLVAEIKTRKQNSESTASRKRARPRRSRVVLQLGEGCSVSVKPGVTLEMFVTALRDLLQRCSGLEPQSDLADAVKALADPQL